MYGRTVKKLFGVTRNNIVLTWGGMEMFCEKEDGVEGWDWRLRYLITTSEVRENL